MKQISKCLDSNIMKEVPGDLSKTMKLLKTEILAQMDVLVNAVKCLRYNQLPDCKNTSLVKEGLLIINLSQTCNFKT